MFFLSKIKSWIELCSSVIFYYIIIFSNNKTNLLNISAYQGETLNSVNLIMELKKPYTLNFLDVSRITSIIKAIIKPYGINKFWKVEVYLYTHNVGLHSYHHNLVDINIINRSNNIFSYINSIDFKNIKNESMDTGIRRFSINITNITNKINIKDSSSS
jgi:hypothetical protein